ncbi:MAG TPA: CGNR zinc finger domain-containing protein [Actinomycetes bacterium]
MCSRSSPPRSGSAPSRRRRWQRSIGPARPLLGSPSWRPASWWFATTRRRPTPSWPTSPPPPSPWSAGPGGTGCGRWFVASRPRQRWCSPTCGNRARVARFQERRRGRARRP